MTDENVRSKEKFSESLKKPYLCLEDCLFDKYEIGKNIRRFNAELQGNLPAQKFIRRMYVNSSILGDMNIESYFTVATLSF